MDILKLQNILLELRAASRQLNSKPTDEELRSLMKKYDMLFLGEKFNYINSLELAHSLRTVFAMDVNSDQLNELIPSVCKALNMKCEPMIELSQASNPNPPIHSYQITLWE